LRRKKELHLQKREEEIALGEGDERRVGLPGCRAAEKGGLQSKRRGKYHEKNLQLTPGETKFLEGEDEKGWYWTHGALLQSQPGETKKRRKKWTGGKGLSFSISKQPHRPDLVVPRWYFKRAKASSGLKRVVNWEA